MKKYLIILLAILILTSVTNVEGKKQNVQQNSNVNNQIKGGHYNTIVTNVDQMSQIQVGNNNKVPYGQLKKTAGFGTYSEIKDTAIDQVTSIDSSIIGGHHNMIVVDSKQVATLSESLIPIAYWGAGNQALNQAAIIENKIISGHHNAIMIESIQQAYLNPKSPGYGSENVNQLVFNSNQIIGGHHNTISVGANQIAQPSQSS